MTTTPQPATRSAAVARSPCRRRARRRADAKPRRDVVVHKRITLLTCGSALSDDVLRRTNRARGRALLLCSLLDD
jgi:hypothetical protein